MTGSIATTALRRGKFHGAWRSSSFAAQSSAGDAKRHGPQLPCRRLLQPYRLHPSRRLRQLLLRPKRRHNRQHRHHHLALWTHSTAQWTHGSRGHPTRKSGAAGSITSAMTNRQLSPRHRIHSIASQASQTFRLDGLWPRRVGVAGSMARGAVMVAADAPLLSHSIAKPGLQTGCSDGPSPRRGGAAPTRARDARRRQVVAHEISCKPYFELAHCTLRRHFTMRCGAPQNADSH